MNLRSYVLSCLLSKNGPFSAPTPYNRLERTSGASFGFPAYLTTNTYIICLPWLHKHMLRSKTLLPVSGNTSALADRSIAVKNHAGMALFLTMQSIVSLLCQLSCSFFTFRHISQSHLNPISALASKCLAIIFCSWPGGRRLKFVFSAVSILSSLVRSNLISSALAQRVFLIRQNGFRWIRPYY